MDRRPDSEMSGFVELLLPARPRYVSFARALLTTAALRSGFTEAQAGEMAVAMSEAFTNVIQHAKTSWVTIRYTLEPRGMTIEVEDDGEGFDTSILEQPYTPEADVGRGMHLIRSLMDTVECRSSPMGTVVRMTRGKETPVQEGLPWKVTVRPFPTTGHIRRALERYRRDLALMLGEVEPIEGDIGDLAILERFEAAEDKKRLISDRKLRLKTLKATLEILREDLEDEPIS